MQGCSCIRSALARCRVSDVHQFLHNPANRNGGVMLSNLEWLNELI